MIAVLFRDFGMLDYIGQVLHLSRMFAQLTCL